jgi:hypothetical protein
MRSLALSALLGSFIASTSLVGQSLTEHAAAAAGATIGTAAGKPLGTALGNIFGNVDKSTSQAANPKSTKAVATKPVASKPTPVAPAETAQHPATVVIAHGQSSADIGGGGGDGGGSSHPLARRREVPVEAEPAEVAPIVPVVVEPVVKEPTVAEVASIKVGATAGELRDALGAPESTISIPDDDGHLLEIRQYWAKGEPIGTIRLDNGRVVSVQTSN